MSNPNQSPANRIYASMLGVFAAHSSEFATNPNFIGPRLAEDLDNQRQQLDIGPTDPLDIGPIDPRILITATAKAHIDVCDAIKDKRAMGDYDV